MWLVNQTEAIPCSGWEMVIHHYLPPGLVLGPRNQHTMH